MAMVPIRRHGLPLRAIVLVGVAIIMDGLGITECGEAI
jgi:hypothetical protein